MIDNGGVVNPYTPQEIYQIKLVTKQWSINNINPYLVQEMTI